MFTRLIALSFTFWAGSALAADMPPGVSTRTTIYGHIFTLNDKALYVSALDKPDKSECTLVNITEQQDNFSNRNFPLPYKDGERRPCADKWIPFVAAANAKPMGDWTTVERDDATRQWAYQHRPVYTASADRSAAEMNPTVDRTPLTAPFDAPDGIHMVTVEEGAILVDAKKAPLYTRDDDKAAEAWHPVTATAAARSTGDWTIAPGPGGVRQWSYKGRALYTYGEVTAAQLPLQTPGGALAVVYKTPAAPPGFKTTWGPRGLIYTDADGMTLYVFKCREDSKERLSCDQPGDTPAWYHSLCGGPTRCGEVFQPARAPDGAKENEAWTVRRIDPANPMRKLAAGEGVPTWHYYGRPVLRYAEDLEPTDFYGIGLRIINIAQFQPLVVNITSNTYYMN